MSHVTAADAVLAEKVATLLGRRVTARRVAELRESGLITWPHRAGKKGKPGREAGVYAKGAEVQAAEALELIRSKVDESTAAVILYLRGWPVSTAARRRFVTATVPRMSSVLTEFTAATADDPDVWVREIAQRDSDETRALRMALGENAAEVFEWIMAVFSGNEDAINAPNPDIARALALEPWTDAQVDYEDDEFFEPQAPQEVVDRVRSWFDSRAQLDATALDGLDEIAGNEVAWTQAKDLILVMREIELARKRLADLLPRTAADAEIPMQAVYTRGRTPLVVEKHMAWLSIWFLMRPADEDDHDDAVRHSEQGRDGLRALFKLAEDCPRRWRPRLDELLTSSKLDPQEPISEWLASWSERNKEQADLIKALN